jgi:hypothetical protein
MTPPFFTVILRPPKDLAVSSFVHKIQNSSGSDLRMTAPDDAFPYFRFMAIHTFEDFLNSLKFDECPSDLSPHLQAMWHDHRGDWDASHTCIQDLPDARAAHIHAYLHRKEGDIWNADYWYRRAKRERPALSLEEEWEQITRTFF